MNSSAAAMTVYKKHLYSAITKSITLDDWNGHQQSNTELPPVQCNNHVSLFKDFNIIAIKGLGKIARRRTFVLFYVELRGVRVRLTVTPPGGQR